MAFDKGKSRKMIGIMTAFTSAAFVVLSVAAKKMRRIQHMKMTQAKRTHSKGKKSSLSKARMTK